MTEEKDRQLESTPDEESELPAAKRLAAIVYKSFEYSQGDAHLQKNLFRYISLIRPKWKTPDRILDLENLSTELKELTHQMAYARLRGNKKQAIDKGETSASTINHFHLEGMDFQVVTGDMCNNFLGILDEDNFPDELGGASLGKMGRLWQILYSIVSSEYKYLFRKDGRENRLKDYDKNSKWENYFSYIREYIGEVRPDPEPVFAQLFAELRELVGELLVGQIDESNEDSLKMLVSLAQRWEEVHPGEKFFEPFDLPETKADIIGDDHD